jgi:hypothetical protein
VGNTRTQSRSRTSRSWGRQPATKRHWGRTQPVAKRGRGTAKKGMLMAAAPMLGGVAMKVMRSRKQKKAESSAWSTDQPDVVTKAPVIKTPAEV